MTRVIGRMVYTMPKWRMKVAAFVIYPVAWAYALGLISEARIDRFTDVLAKWVCGNVGKCTRIEWRDNG